MKRIFVQTAMTEEPLKLVFRLDFRCSLDKYMTCIKDGFWRSDGREIKLDETLPKASHYVAAYILSNGKRISLEGKIQQAIEYRESETCYFVCSTLYKKKREIVLISSSSNKTEEMRIECPSDKRLDFCFEKGEIRIENSDFSTRIELSIHPALLTNEPPASRFKKIIVRDGNLSILVLLPQCSKERYPAITVCLGGPYIAIPDYEDSNSIYQLFLKNGFAVIIPLRRGVIGLSQTWANALDGKLGKADVEDIIAGTKAAVSQVPEIDKEHVGIYGASYGGYTALLAAEATDGESLFNAVCTVCGMSDPANYPKESQGDAEDTRRTYKSAPSPLENCVNLHKPILIIHTCDDETVWFGQSVRLYNKLLACQNSPAQLLLFSGPHSMDIPDRDILENAIIDFFVTLSGK